jgi:uncharacterized membrane protein HdeD (DUF308 family)
MQYLAYLFGVVSLVCWIMTLVKMFTDKEKGGVLHGVIGIICGLWAFIWGWMNAARHSHQKVMLIWTIAIVAGMICNFVFAASALQSR